MIEKEADDDAPVAVPIDHVLRVAESALALIGATLAGASGGHIVERIVGLWRAGRLEELVAMLDAMRDNLPPPPEAVN